MFCFEKIKWHFNFSSPLYMGGSVLDRCSSAHIHKSTHMHCAWSLSLRHFSSLLLLNRDNSPRQGSALHPNNEVQLFALFVNEGKRAHSGGQLQAVDTAPWLPVVPGRASLSQGLLRAEWASLGSSCQCWGGEGEREKAPKVEPVLCDPFASGADGLAGCSISSSAFVR